jgi:hypothetical protein
MRGALRLAGGKLAGRGVVNAVRPGEDPINGGRLFFITDSSSSRRFLVDTGSTFSIIPFRSSARPSGPVLRSTNNARIRCWGRHGAAVVLSSQRFEFQFLLADVRFPILGIDFLRHFQLVVDVCADRLLPRSALAQPVGGDVFAVQQQTAAPAREADEWQAILDEFPGVSQPFLVATTPSHCVEHVIETTDRPTTAKFWRLDPVRLAEAKQEFQKMLEVGVVRRSSSCWSSPLHMVKKKCGGWQP